MILKIFTTIYLHFFLNFGVLSLIKKKLFEIYIKKIKLFFSTMALE